MTAEPDPPKIKPGYDVWFGLQHVTLSGFRHSGRRRNCPRCNPALTHPATGAQPRLTDPPEDASR